METYESKLLSLIEKNRNIVVITAENRISLRNIPPKLGINFIDVGISEQNLVGIGAGLAKQGFLPVMHGMSAFLTMRAFEFIRTDLGYPSLSSVLVGTFNGLSAAGNGTANGPTHQAVEDIALMRLIQNMTIFAPSDVTETCNGLDYITKLKGPLYIRDSNFGAIDIKREKFLWGKNEWIVQGNDIAILSYGTILSNCLEASKKLDVQNISHSVYNMRFLKPMDEQTLDHVFQNHKTIFVIEDHINTGGLGSIVKEYAWRNKKPQEIVLINLKDNFFKPANFNVALVHAGFSAEKIYEQIIKHTKEHSR
jgi:transketolase